MLYTLLRQFSLVHIFTDYFFIIYINLTILSTLRSIKWFLVTRFSYENLECISYFSLACCVSYPPHFLVLITLIMLDDTDKL